MYDYKTDPKLSDSWKSAFDVIDKFGWNGYKDPLGYKALPFKQRFNAISNILAVFFGPFYFLFLGLHKVAISVLLINIILVLIMAIISTITDLSLPSSSLIIVHNIFIANTAFYNFKVKDYRGWNPYFNFKLGR